MLYLLEDGSMIQCYDSDNEAFDIPNGCCEGYNLFNPDGTYNDGGEFEFDPNKIKSEDTLINKTIEFATDKKQKKTLIKATSDCAYEDIVELFTEEFYQKELFKLKTSKKITNDYMKAKIDKAYKILVERNKMRGD